MISKRGSAVLWIIIVVLIICLAVGGFITYSYLSKPRIVSESSEQVSACTDSDGNEIYKKGFVSSNYDANGEGGSTLEDWCEYNHPKIDRRVGLVREGICEGNTLKQVYMTCGWGFVCRDGACVERDKSSPICSDSDYGKDTSKRGWITGYGGTGRDECWISTSEDKTQGVYSDSCGVETGTQDNCYVYEYFCNGPDRKEYEIIKCSNGCSNGACI